MLQSSGHLTTEHPLKIIIYEKTNKTELKGN